VAIPTGRLGVVGQHIEDPPVGLRCSRVISRRNAPCTVISCMAAAWPAPSTAAHRSASRRASWRLGFIPVTRLRRSRRSARSATDGRIRTAPGQPPVPASSETTVAIASSSSRSNGCRSCRGPSW